jgi:hypothetical protein
MLSADFGCHAQLGWGQPACALDPYVEFRHFTNDGAVKSGEREKGFYSLSGALQYFCEDGIDTAHKDEMRDVSSKDRRSALTSARPSYSTARKTSEHSLS